MKKFLLILAILAIIALPAMAQDTIIDPVTVDNILMVGVFGGFGVIAITELLKRLLKTQGKLSVILSIVVSLGVTAAYLAINEIFTILSFAIYSVIVALAANGIYLFPKSRNG